MSAAGRQTATENARSARAMITAPHWMASDAGARVLARGGNAIEALVAAGSPLTAVSRNADPNG